MRVWQWDVCFGVPHSVDNDSIFYIYPRIILDLWLAQRILYLGLQPYSVQSKRINMTEEEVEEAIQILREADKMINTPEKARQFLIAVGSIKAPKKKKKAKRKTK